MCAFATVCLLCLSQWWRSQTLWQLQSLPLCDQSCHLCFFSFFLFHCLLCSTCFCFCVCCMVACVCVCVFYSLYTSLCQPLLKRRRKSKSVVPFLFPPFPPSPFALATSSQAHLSFFLLFHSLLVSPGGLARGACAEDLNSIVALISKRNLFVTCVLLLADPLSVSPSTLTRVCVCVCSSTAPPPSPCFRSLTPSLRLSHCSPSFFFFQLCCLIPFLLFFFSVFVASFLLLLLFLLLPYFPLPLRFFIFFKKKIVISAELLLLLLLLFFASLSFLHFCFDPTLPLCSLGFLLLSQPSSVRWKHYHSPTFSPFLVFQVYPSHPVYLLSSYTHSLSVPLSLAPRFTYRTVKNISKKKQNRFLCNCTGTLSLRAPLDKPQRCTEARERERDSELPIYRCAPQLLLLFGCFFSRFSHLSLSVLRFINKDFCLV